MLRRHHTIQYLEPQEKLLLILEIRISQVQDNMEVIKKNLSIRIQVLVVLALILQDQNVI